MPESISAAGQVVSNGERVWVNGPQGWAIARLGYAIGLALIDVHGPGGDECVVCTAVEANTAAWERFVRAVLEVHGVTVGEEHRPRWAKQQACGRS